MYATGGMAASFVQSGFPLLGLQATSNAAEIVQQVTRLVRSGGQQVSIPYAPLMHGTGIWIGAFVPHVTGACVVTLQGRSLDPHESLSTVERERATQITIVGDAFAKPIVAAIDTRGERPYDLCSMWIGAALYGGIAVACARPGFAGSSSD